MSVLLALLLDALFGEPKWVWDRVPHPAVVMGRGIGWLDARLNDGTRIAGVIAVASMVAVALIVGWVLTAVFGALGEVLVGAVLLAQRSLVEHVRAVADGLRRSVTAGRASVAMIVGRDTRSMDGPAVARGAIESAAENFSDGVIAPLFWFVFGGLPGLIAYKVVNTADSMIGYRTPKYENFGWAAARLDDVLNWFPARITALLIWCVDGCRASLNDIARDAALHRSPNAGWPEAAMAPALGVALSGPRSYDGRMQEFAWVHPAGRRHADAGDIDAAVRVLWRAWALAFVLVGFGVLIA